MFNILNLAEQALPDLLQSREGWHSLDVLYDPPHVERLWRDFPCYSGVTLSVEPYRLYLHRIHPCEKALYHPHPWPSVIKILEGGYEMGVGFGEGDQEPPLAALLKLSPGAAYAMTHLDGWHYVLPSVVNLSIMITGKPWPRWSPGPGPDVKLGPLSDDASEDLLNAFRVHYPRQDRAA